MKNLTATQKKWFEYMALMLELHHDNGVRFDLGRWLNTQSSDRQGWCGTKGCACGLAALNPTFNQAGFKNSPWGITFNKLEGWSAVIRFFKITGRQAEWLFAVSSYKGQTHGDKAARKVAKRIREFIASNGTVPATFKQEVFS